MLIHMNKINHLITGVLFHPERKFRKVLLLLLTTPLILLFSRTEEYEPINELDHVFLVQYIANTNSNLEEDEIDRLAMAILLHSPDLVIPDHIDFDGMPVDPLILVTAFIEVESTFNRKAVSIADARGYMQLMLDTVAWMDARNDTVTPEELIFQPETNISLGVEYLNYLFDEMEDLRRVSLAYNAGPGAVRRGFWVERYWQKISLTYRKIQGQHTAFNKSLDESMLSYSHDL